MAPPSPETINTHRVQLPSHWELTNMEKEVFKIGGKVINELRVVDLKKELEKRGLSKSGSKIELIKRLKTVGLCYIALSAILSCIFMKTMVIFYFTNRKCALNVYIQMLARMKFPIER